MGYSVFSTPTGALAPTGSALSVVAPNIVPLPAAPVVQPSWLSSLWSGITTPVANTVAAIGKSYSSALPTVIKASGESLSTILMQKAGLIPKPQKQADGTTVIYYEKPNQGITPPNSLTVVQPAVTGAGGGSGAKTWNVSWGVIAIAVAVVFGLILFARQK